MQNAKCRILVSPTERIKNKMGKAMHTTCFFRTHFAFCIQHFALINKRHGEGEFGFPVPAGDGDILTVAAYDGFDNV